MKQKSRKLLVRIGAALMLGLSLFNFGAAWSKLKGGTFPRRARNIRKQTQEQIDPEVQRVADVAEEEALNVLAVEQLGQEQQQQLQQETLTVFQRTVRYVAVVVWAASAGLAFTSIVFNYPFAAGKGLLSLLPGEPHVASVSLVARSDYFQVSDRIQVDAKLNTNGEAIEQVRLAVEYDPSQLKFENYEVNGQLFEEVREQKIDSEHGKIMLAFASARANIVSRNEVVGSLFFESLGKTSRCKVGIVQEESAVIKQKKDELHNVLGRVLPAEFQILAQRNPAIICSRIEAGQTDNLWGSLSQSAILPDKNTKWTEIGEDWTFTCGHNGGNELYLLVSGPKELSSINFETGNETESNVFLNIEKKWRQGEQHFFGSVIKDSKITEDVSRSVQDVGLQINTPNDSLRWPQQGSAVFVLD